MYGLFRQRRGEEDWTLIRTAYTKKELRKYLDLNADYKIEEVPGSVPKHIHEQKASDIQIGGGHYKDMAIQPTEFIHKNKLSFIQGNVIKYITRYKHKNGLEDLKKVKHYIDLLIEMEYPEEGK